MPLNTKTLMHVFIFGIFLMMSSALSAQNEFAATLEVLNTGVEVQRVNTVNPIPVSVEAIVGVGDVIRTNETGRARITFFADGTDVTLEPNSEYRIVEFQGDDEDFQLTVEILVGQATHRLNRVLGASSKYDVETPGMTLAARGTVFAIRVENNGRSGMLVREGTVDASTEESRSDVPVDYGIRAESQGSLSDVVKAASFAELDAALDGCSVSVKTVDDVRLNVRQGPSLDAPRIGTAAADELQIFMGASETSNWYRINFRGGFGWLLSSSAEIDRSCAGLRMFPASYLEDPSAYEELGDIIDENSLINPVSTEESGN